MTRSGSHGCLEPQRSAPRRPFPPAGFSALAAEEFVFGHPVGAGRPSSHGVRAGSSGRLLLFGFSADPPSMVFLARRNEDETISVFPKLSLQRLLGFPQGRGSSCPICGSSDTPFHQSGEHPFLMTRGARWIGRLGPGQKAQFSSAKGQRRG